MLSKENSRDWTKLIRNWTERIDLIDEHVLEISAWSVYTCSIYDVRGVQIRLTPLKGELVVHDQTRRPAPLNLPAPSN